MNNYKLTLSYDGTGYCGWQIQNNAKTVQQTITDAIKVLLKEDVSLIGSGRTDTGVHALSQVANFRTDKEIDIRKFRHSLNAILPQDISINEITAAGEDFHARFDAKRRSYIYLILRDKSPFYNRFAPVIRKDIDTDYLNHLSQALLGEHDYTSFARKKSEVENKKCTIYSARWKQTRGFVLFYIEANRFLHGMVRTTVGSLLKAGGERLGQEYLIDVLNSRDREAAAEAAPAKGLFLYKVKY